MNKLLWIAIGTALWQTVAILPARAGNVLLNPGFESDPTGQTQTIGGWNQYGGNSYSETDTNAHSGTNYFKVYQAFNGSVNYTGVYQDYISGPGAIYTADGWAKTLSSDAIAGGNEAWIEVTFRDANANVLALYRSTIITPSFPKNAWTDLAVTNLYNVSGTVLSNSVKTLVAPAGTYFVRCQIVFQGDDAGSGGSVYFDDMTLSLASAAPYGNWNIVWNDEFNGTSINTKTWTFESGNNGGWGNNELEYYTSNSANAHVTNGLLHITALNQSIQGFNFSSARMKTQGLVSWLYGRFEWRAKFPAGTGFWPALWFLGTNFPSAGWPACGEMDVTENSGTNPAYVQGSLHSGSDETGIYNFLNGDSVTNFHTYVLDWSTNSFSWYVDGHLYETQNGWYSSTGPFPAPFNKPSFMIMNLAVGGNYVGNPSVAQIQGNGGFPGDMQIDYVRVYNSTAPLTLSVVKSNSTVSLNWATNIVAHLQVQTGSPLTTNWLDVSNSSNPYVLTGLSKNAYYRLESP